MYLFETSLCRFVLTFAVGAGPVPGLLLPEIFPSRIRAKAMAFCMSVHWVISLIKFSIFLFTTGIRHLSSADRLRHCSIIELGKWRSGKKIRAQKSIQLLFLIVFSAFFRWLTFLLDWCSCACSTNLGHTYYTPYLAPSAWWPWYL